MKTACYIRVSTNEQTPENQLPAILEYCRAHAWPEPVVYAENESAWRNGHQRELARLLDDIRSSRRKYDALVVFALDRLSRQGPLAVLQLIDTFKSYGVKVESVKEPFTALPYGFDNVLYSFLAWAAKYESDRKSQNTRAGLERARAAGVKLGRPAGCKDRKQRRKKRPVVFKYAGIGTAGIPQ